VVQGIGLIVYLPNCHPAGRDVATVGFRDGAGVPGAFGGEGAFHLGEQRRMPCPRAASRAGAAPTMPRPDRGYTFHERFSAPASLVFAAETRTDKGFLAHSASAWIIEPDSPLVCNQLRNSGSRGWEERCLLRQQRCRVGDVKSMISRLQVSAEIIADS
jgi:hypothetical protein